MFEPISKISIVVIVIITNNQNPLFKSKRGGFKALYLFSTLTTPFR